MDAGEKGPGDPPLPPPEEEGGEPETYYLSADDSNSQSSPVLVRGMIEDGWTSIPLDQLRVWEFLNYYDISYEPEPLTSPLRVTQQLRPYDMDAGLYALQIGVQGRRLTEDRRRPVNATLVLDTSGAICLSHPGARRRLVRRRFPPPRALPESARPGYTYPLR